MHRRILGLLLAVLLPLIAGACVSETDVREEIEQANYCQEADDCVNLGSHCPFGCYVLVNEAEAVRIMGLIQDYYDQHGEQCMYDCMAISGIDCQAERCEAIPLEW